VLLPADVRGGAVEELERQVQEGQDGDRSATLHADRRSNRGAKYDPEK
jgi:hypothetical protein